MEALNEQIFEWLKIKTFGNHTTYFSQSGIKYFLKDQKWLSGVNESWVFVNFF